MRKLLLAALTILTASCASTGVASCEWLDPWQHGHASPRGTPYVHPIGMEPAFLGREVLLSYHHRDSPGETGDEVEAELEWAITKRLGIAIELPLVRKSETGGATHQGIGDFAVAPRAVLVQTDGFLIAASIGLTLPTGDSQASLGGNEVSLGPALTTWSDLGNRLTLQVRIGTEYRVRTGDTLLDYHASLIWMLADGQHESDHLHAHMASLIAEIGGRTILDGPSDSRTTGEALFGVSYALAEQWELRGGYLLPVGRPRDTDRGFVIGAIFHF